MLHIWMTLAAPSQCKCPHTHTHTKNKFSGWPQVEHLDGHKVDVGRQGVTRPGQVVRIEGEGMPVFEKVSESGRV